jgi:hypothetical protein
LEYKDLKEIAKLKFEEFTKNERKKMSAIITNVAITKEPWVKIDNLINSKSKTIMNFPDKNKEEIINGFSEIYGANDKYKIRFAINSFYI